MEEKTLFSFKSTNLSYANSLFWFLLIVIPFGCIISLVGSALISLLAEELFSLELPSYFMLVLFALLVISGPLYGFKSRLVMLTIDSEKLLWRTVWKKVQQINRNEIQKAQFDKKGRLILDGNLIFNPNVLPQKKRIEFGAVLPQWLPETAHTPEYQEHLHWKRKFLEDWQDAPFSITAHTNKQKYIWVRRICFIGIVIIVGLIIWFISTEPNQGILTFAIYLGAMLFLLTIVIWKSTEYKSVQVNEKGITYQRSKKELFFAWHEIEVLAFRGGSQHLLIWQGKRYRSYSYSRMDVEMINEVAKTIFQQAAIRNIPMAMV